MSKTSASARESENSPSVCPKTESLVTTLENKFGLKVTAKNSQNGRGKLVIDYTSITDLDALITLIEKS
ncbi:hypothetical protein [Psychromonas sp. GE-S-Ul-11]|uniref:hypothetical protein n=1 Tax=Psychromonas sp. GE-S-Ul-11 TaxID=3241170 RepID=UPI003AAD1895